jgi:hypothetical protein
MDCRNSYPPMNHHSILNQAPALVAFGLRTGLLSVRPSEPVSNQPTTRQLYASRDGMRTLRVRSAKAKILDLQEDIGLT